MRSIPVADATRSILFYREILGFELRDQSGSIDAVYGPARIHFDTQDDAPTNDTAPRPRRSAILFFQTDDVEAMRAGIHARGGEPSEIEGVNRIKMRIFEIRDPDAHRLWFGQSYDKPHAPRPLPLLRKALPDLPFRDVAAAVAYYRDVLGFRINYQQHDLGVMDRDDITVLLIPRTELYKGIGSAYVYVEDADVLYAELLGKGATLKGEPESHPWGLRDFQVVDLEGNRITFGQPFE